jgi:5-formyltetrahydrofolate cyclo-ligase
MNTELQKAKKKLRKRVLGERDAQDPKLRALHSHDVVRRLLALDEYAGASTVLFFLSFRSEVLTEEAVRAALAQGRRVVVPVSDTARRELILYQIIDYDADLVTGAYGIPEPAPDRTTPVDAKDLDFVLVPGAVFDPACRRIGYGGGYYDGFFPRLRARVPRVAVAFDLQIVPKVPTEPHDLPVDAVVTQNRVLRLPTPS